ncbi:hypothetical protein FA15DRAFT_656494 [Coprinopsis marcescibilis]|uniref:Uncharacterized protein n=1 Tax=Coprinopsis marcescibilis TaxID=230819 RepID=A0A5C3KTI9_COPMA|nr:hypothetical protein FA15DRAFT_656494 [Coprinopsis marcescibilis]
MKLTSSLFITSVALMAATLASTIAAQDFHSEDHYARDVIDDGLDMLYARGVQESRDTYYSRDAAVGAITEELVRRLDHELLEARHLRQLTRQPRRPPALAKSKKAIEAKKKNQVVRRNSSTPSQPSKAVAAPNVKTWLSR